MNGELITDIFDCAGCGKKTRITCRNFGESIIVFCSDECREKYKEKNKPESHRPKVWLLTYEMNDYDQHGEYFARLWLNKPTLQQMEEFLIKIKEKPNLAQHVLDGGGRKDIEYCWYHLKQIELS